MTRKGKKVRSPKALQSRGDYRLGVCSPPKDLKFWGSEMPFPALSTGHFNKYERKSKWLEYILPISNVVVKVQCLRKKGKTVTPSRKLQAKGKIACMTAVSPRLYCEISLVRPVTGGVHGVRSHPPPPTGSNGPHFDTQYPS